MIKILFQGDSITDSGRDYENPQDLGRGYPVYVAARLGLECPGQYEFCNRGISGNKIADIYARKNADIFDVKPDYISLLVGVNDVWHGLANWGTLTTVSDFEKSYRKLLEEIRQLLPDTHVTLFEPFVLPGSGTNDYYQEFLQLLSERATVVRMLAEEYRCTFVPMQEKLELMAEKTPANYWLADGVHPTLYCHQYIADCWMEAFDRWF